MKRVLSVMLALCLLVMALPLTASAAKIDSMTDVGNHWGREAISYCLEKGYMNGEGGGKFSPNGPVTRAQVAQVLWNREGNTSTAGLKNPFKDVGGKWYHNAVLWCADQKIVNGKGNDKFAPNDRVTRQDICVMIYRYYREYLGKPVAFSSYQDMLAKYTDMVKRTAKGEKHYAEDALCWANKVGLMNGKGNGILNPNGYCIRAELAQLLKNLDKVLATPFTGIYNPNPPSANFVNSKMFNSEFFDYWVNFDRDRYSKDNWKERIEDRFGNSYANYDLTSMPEVGGPAVSRSGWIPKGGYTDGSFHTVDLGSGNYLEIADSGTIFNKYDVDVSSVDGLLTDLEAQAYEYIAAGVAGSGEELSVLETNFRLDQFTQMIAEAANREAIENIDNLVHAGFSLGSIPVNPKGNTFEEYIINGSPEVSRRLLEISKTAFSKAEAKAILTKEFNPDEWVNPLEILVDLRAREFIESDNDEFGGEYYFSAYDYKGLRAIPHIRNYSIRFDHTPDAVEIANAVDYTDYMQEIMLGCVHIRASTTRAK